MGMLRARGKNLLFADADGATTFSELLKMEKELGKVERNGQGLVCGSRAHLQVSKCYVLLKKHAMFVIHEEKKMYLLKL